MPETTFDLETVEMTLETTKKFRQSKDWKVLCRKVYHRANGQCECPGGYENGGERGSQPCSNRIENIHHLIYPIIPETITLDELQGLCRTCHATRHEKNSVLDTLPCCRYRGKSFPILR